MIPPGHFMVLAEVLPGRDKPLREVLARMNAGPGQADPHTRLLPFARFESLHFARLAILEDVTHGDIAAHGVAPGILPTYLAFFGDCDGDGGRQLDEFAQAAQAGLLEVFSHCKDAPDGARLAAW